jgi:hypothetical protein
MKKKQENRTTQLAAHRKVDELSQGIVKLLCFSKDKELKGRVLLSIMHIPVFEKIQVDHLVKFLLEFISRISHIGGLSIDKYLYCRDEGLTIDYFLDIMGIELNEIYSIQYSSRFENLLNFYKKWTSEGKENERNGNGI